MKVLYDYAAFSRQFYGGVSRYYVELARQLSQCRDTQLKIVSPLYINHHLAELDPGLVSGRQVRRVPREMGRILNLYNHASTRAQARVYRPDILHETYFTPGTCVPDGSCARVVTVHDMIHEKYPENFLRSDSTASNKRAAIARADHVICVSDSTRRDLLELGDVEPDKVSVVRHGFTSPEIPESSSEKLMARPYLLYVGIRSGYKNFPALLEAYAASSALRGDYQLVCFGGGNFSRTERALVRTLGLPQDCLVSIGGSDSVLVQLYQHAAAFVYPSLSEGFGIPPLEAMVNGCPVVCSNGGAIPEVVAEAGEFFDPRDTSSISRAIETVVGSRVRTAALRAAGKQRVSNFTWEQCAADTRNVYSKLL
jgi:glycosyltransferase involved in cell wall biosynthesis